MGENCWGEPCCDSELPHKLSNQWRCVWCGHVFRSRDYASFTSVAKADAPKLIRCHTAIDADKLSMYLYCAKSCHVQSMPPSIQEKQLQDFLTFCAVRNAITELRPVMSSPRAFKRLIEEYERDGDQDKAVWVRVLRHMYNHTKTPIYSILAMQDPCVQNFHQLIQTAITLSCPRLFFVVLLLFAKSQIGKCSFS